MASVHSAEENQLLVDEFRGQEFWIGLFRVDDEGTFAYSDGSTLGWTNWNGGEPNNWRNNEDCTVVKAYGGWNDLKCGANRRYACKYQTSAEAALGQDMPYWVVPEEES